MREQAIPAWHAYTNLIVKHNFKLAFLSTALPLRS